MKIAYLSSFPPKNCGIARFCFDLIEGIKNNDPKAEGEIYAIDNIPEGYQYSLLVRDHFFYQNKPLYSQIAENINQSGAQLCVIQHEFGLFGGEEKEYLFDFVNNLKIPIIVILHTVPIDPNYETFNIYKKHILELNKKTKRFVVMSNIGRIGLSKLGIDSKKITVIIHGAPKMPPLSMAKKFKKELGIENSFTVMDFGLFNKKKGIEFLLKAVALLKDKFVNLKCLIVGIPLSPKHHGYVEMLKKYSNQLKLDKIVIFIEKFLKEEELGKFIVACEVIVTPYLSTNQASSGVLTFSIAAGIPVISTPYPYAKELLKNIGILIPYEDSRAIAQKITRLIEDKNYYHLQQQKTLEFGKTLSWDKKAKEYLALFNKILSEKNWP